MAFYPENVAHLAFQDEGYPTDSSLQQLESEQSCALFFSNPDAFPPEQKNLFFSSEGGVNLLREAHIRYLQQPLASLSANFEFADTTRPWYSYWCLHSLDLLDAFPEDLALIERIIDTLARFLYPCRNMTAFGGGPQQLPHMAPTYAAVMSLLICGAHELRLKQKLSSDVSHESCKAYQLLFNIRPALYAMLIALKNPDSGAFRVHHWGEADTRASYTALAVADLLNLLTDELTEKCPEFFASCQSYEGGLGGEPFNEAHGGYAYCGLAGAKIVNGISRLDMPKLLRWLTKRQLKLEGGFSGRSNKLVDGCYSFWQGASFALVHEYVTSQGTKTCFDGLLERRRLQQYILHCCQQLEGGLRDKPTKPRDHYHSCYCLSGLSLAQRSFDAPYTPLEEHRVGPSSNILKATHPVYNIRPEHVEMARQAFGSHISNTPSSLGVESPNHHALMSAAGIHMTRAGSNDPPADEKKGVMSNGFIRIVPSPESMANHWNIQQ